MLVFSDKRKELWTPGSLPRGHCEEGECGRPGEKRGVRRSSGEAVVVDKGRRTRVSTWFLRLA